LIIIIIIIKSQHLYLSSLSVVAWYYEDCFILWKCILFICF